MKNQLSSPLAGFKSIKRYWSAKDNSTVASIIVGEFYVTREDEIISTCLGSCVAACIWDPVAKVGGMNHFLLPNRDDAMESVRYGGFAMESLLNRLLSSGGRRERFAVKVFGGGDIIGNTESSIGLRNIAFVRELLQTEGLRLLGEDLGSRYQRSLQFFPQSGRARIRKRHMDEEVMAKEMIDNQTNLDKLKSRQTVELF